MFHLLPNFYVNKNSNTMNLVSKLSTVVLLQLLFATSSMAELAFTPGVTTTLMDDINKVEDEELRELLKSAVWPGYGEVVLDLDRPENELSKFEKNYKKQPLTWDEKIENVKYVLNLHGSPERLTKENIEYKDVEFGEAVIPIPDRRVMKILNTLYLQSEFDKLEQEKLRNIDTAYQQDPKDFAKLIQTIEDEYAQNLALLVQIENKYKEAKIDFLKLENKLKYGRIDDETFQNETRDVVENFENSLVIGSKSKVFDKNKTKQIANSIYDNSIQLNNDSQVEAPIQIPSTSSSKYVYWTLSLIMMVISIFLGYLGFKYIKK